MLQSEIPVEIQLADCSQIGVGDVELVQMRYYVARCGRRRFHILCTVNAAREWITCLCLIGRWLRNVVDDGEEVKTETENGWK